MTEKAPNYLINLIPQSDSTIRTRNNSMPTFHYRTDCFKNSFYPSTLNDWFSLDINIRNSESISLFCYLSFALFKTTYIIFLTQNG